MTVHFGSAEETLHAFQPQSRPCDVCGERAGVPQYLCFSMHEPVFCAWCSERCLAIIVNRILEESHFYRASLGDVVEESMVHLRRREPVPEKMRHAMTEKEYSEVLGMCDIEYTSAREELFKVLLCLIARKDAMAYWLQTEAHTKAIRERSTQPTPVSLWEA